jgi:hypothetical protein
VPGDDGVDRLLQRPNHVEDLAAAIRRSLLIAKPAHMRDDDHGVRAAAAEVRREAVDDRRRIVEAQALDYTCLGGRLGGSSEKANHADPERAPRDQRIVANPRDVAAVLESNVRSKHAVALVAHSGAERVLSPVELVVAQCRGGVAEVIENLRDGPSERQVRRQRPLKLVATVDENPFARPVQRTRLPRARSSRRVPRRLHAARRRSDGLKGAVKVVRPDDPQPRRRDGRRWLRRRASAQDEHCNERTDLPACVSF